METDALLRELQQDRTFVLSNFFAIAVKDFYNSKVRKVSDLGEQLEKAKLNLNVAELNFNEVNKKAVEEASQKAQEELEAKRLYEIELNQYYDYAIKLFERYGCPKTKLEVFSKEWAKLKTDQGMKYMVTPLEFYKEKMNLPDDWDITDIQDKKEDKS